MRLYPIYATRNAAFSIYTENDAVINIKGAFTEITDYSAEEFINGNISILFDKMRINNCWQSELKHSIDTFIFTKNLEAIEMHIFAENNCQDQQFFFYKKPHLKLDSEFPIINKLIADNHTGVAIYSYPDLKLLNANQKYLDIHDEPFNKKEISFGRKIEEIIPSEIVNWVVNIWNNVAETGKTYYGREIRGFSGSWRNNYCNTTIMPIRCNGKTSFMVLIIEDVTDKVLAKLHYEKQTETIRQQKDQLEAIIENISDALFMIHGNGSYTLLNQAARELFLPSEGYMDDTHRYLEQAEFFDLNGGEVAFENTPLQRILRGEKFTELRLFAKLKNINYYLNISGVPVFDEIGNFQMGILCCRDITEYLKNSKLIGIQKNQLEAIMDNVSELILILDASGKFYYANKVAKSFFKKSSLEGIEKVWEKAVLMDSNRNILTSDKLPHSKVMKTKGAVRTSIIARLGESELYFDIIAVPILDENGNIVFTMTSANDITDHIKSEMLMQKKNDLLEQSLQLKDEFLSLVSHEFKTPLTVINSAIQAMELLCKDELSEKAKGFISKIKQNSYRQIRLVNNLLDITRINAGHLKITRKNTDIIFLTKAITESVSLYARQKDLTLRFVTDLEEKVISLDEEKYERILLNLLSNAIKFSQRGKSIFVMVNGINEKILVDVSDEGMGIPEDKLEIIFERFGQVDSSLSRQAEGTGIGLSLVKLFVEALNGKISVKSKVGVGSIFTITLPDVLITEENTERTLQEFTDNRIIQATVIEFSDIYM